MHETHFIKETYYCVTWAPYEIRSTIKVLDSVTVIFFRDNCNFFSVEETLCIPLGS